MGNVWVLLAVFIFGLVINCQGLTTRTYKFNGYDKRNYGRLGKKTTIPEGMTDFTLCSFFRIETGYGGGDSLSISDQDYDNALLVGTFPGSISTHMPATTVSFTITPGTYFHEWHEFCFTRVGSEGKIYLDGELKNTGTVGSRPFARESYFVFNQDQDSFGAGFEDSNAFAGGYICNVNIWSMVINVPSKGCGELGDVLSTAPEFGGHFVHYLVTQQFENITCHTDEVLINQLVLNYVSTPSAVTYATSTDLGLSSPLSKYTICFWYKLYDSRTMHIPVAVSTVSATGVATENPEFFLISGKVAVYHSGWSVQPVTPAAFTLNKWMRMCETYDNAGQYGLYLDDTKIYSDVVFATGLTAFENAVITIGGDVDSYGAAFQDAQNFRGEVSMVNLWDQFFTAAQLELIKCSDMGNLVAWTSVILQTYGGSTTIEETSAFCPDNRNSVLPERSDRSRNQYFCTLSGWAFSSDAPVLSVIYESDLMMCTHACLTNTACTSFSKPTQTNIRECRLYGVTPMLNPQLLQLSATTELFSYGVC